MSRKSKLILRVSNVDSESFVIAKCTNTLDFGVPGTAISNAEANKILKRHDVRLGDLNVEFLEK